MRHTGICTAVLLGSLTLALSGQSNKAEILLGAGLHQEEVDGNCKEAIKTYQKVIQEKSAPKHIAARAQLHIGACQEKLGQREAHVAYELVLSRYADQTELAAEARSRMAVLGGAPSVDGPRQRLISTGADADNFAFITPDGRWMSRPDWPIGDMVIRDMATGGTKRLLQTSGANPDSAFRAMLSPNGQLVAWVWCQCANEYRYELRVMPNQPQSSSRVLLATEPTANGSEFTFFEPVAWSPDSKSILVNTSRSDRSWELAWVSATDGSKRIIKSLGRRLRQNAPNRPALSPNGQFIAYSALPENPATALSNDAFDTAEKHIYILAANESSEAVKVVKGNSVNESPMWTPDGNHIVFVSNRSGSFALWSTEIRNGKSLSEPVQLMKDTGRISPIAMTRSGAYYFARGDTNRLASDVFIAHVEADSMIPGPATRLSSNSVDQNRSPAWSPDGKWIAFLRGLQQNNYQLVIHSVDAHEERVYSIKSQVRAPVWFHDNKSLLISTGGDFSVLDRESGQSRSLGVAAALLKEMITGAALPPGVPEPPVGLANVGAVTISPDDKTLYVVQRNRIVAFDLLTSQYKEIWKPTTAGIVINGLALSPDGRTLALATARQLGFVGPVVRIATDGSGYRELYPSAFGSLTWSKDGRSILFMGDSQERSQLLRISAEGGKAPSELSTMELRNMSLNPDGSRVVFSTVTRAPELWVLDNISSLLKSR
jgi:Tol biopolymer transport system component